MGNHQYVLCNSSEQRSSHVLVLNLPLTEQMLGKVKLAKFGVQIDRTYLQILYDKSSLHITLSHITRHTVH
jgi:hypothetical protein